MVPPPPLTFFSVRDRRSKVVGVVVEERGVVAAAERGVVADVAVLPGPVDVARVGFAVLLLDGGRVHEDGHHQQRGRGPRRQRDHPMIKSIKSNQSNQM